MGQGHPHAQSNTHVTNERYTMNIIRDEETFGLFMIPLFVDWNIRRCNVKDCTEKPTTIVTGAQEGVPAFGLCEHHYQESKELGRFEYKLIFDDFDAFTKGEQ